MTAVVTHGLSSSADTTAIDVIQSIQKHQHALLHLCHLVQHALATILLDGVVKAATATKVMLGGRAGWVTEAHGFET
jgi:hypothetical protein